MSTKTLIWRAQASCTEGEDVQLESKDVRKLAQVAVSDARELQAERQEITDQARSQGHEQSSSNS
jgi:hypothetical protein